MKRYTAYLIRAMSQTVTFEAPDDADPEELSVLAVAESDLDPNGSNRFDADGDVEVFYVEDAEGTRVYGDGAE